MRWAFAAALSSLVLLGCPGPLATLRHKAAVETTAGTFEIEYAEKDARDTAQLQAALRAAGPKLARWGELRVRVVVHVMPSHELLEQAVGRPGYAWLRAWARYDEVFLQAPHTWSVFGASQRELNELLLHELTHCVMYQQAATASTWTSKEIPLWFREGLATVTADQGYRWPSLEDLARYYETHEDADPVASPDDLYERQSDIVYAAAHHATVFLLKRYGNEKVRVLLRNMGLGADFPRAFEDAIGVAPEGFVAEFKRYVKLRGFRGGRVRNLVPLLKTPANGPVVPAGGTPPPP
ncbi:MAG: peptidase MA family metallohydrolase [Myxococcaceae bacterium]